MTLIYKLDLDISQMYPYTTKKVSKSIISKVRASTWQTNTETHTHRQTRPNVLPQPHLRMVIKNSFVSRYHT